MKKKLLYAIGCAAGGVCVGLFAKQLNTVLGVIVFTVGVVLLSFCIYGLSKDEENEEDR